MGAHDSGPGEHMKDTIDVSVRRSPRYSAFIIVGVVLGMTVGLVLSLLPVDTSALSTQVTRGSVVWMLMVVVGIVGGFLGAIVALVIDRRSLKRARTYQVGAEYEQARSRSARPAPDASATAAGADPARGADPAPAGDPAAEAPAPQPGTGPAVGADERTDIAGASDPESGRGPAGPRTVEE